MKKLLCLGLYLCIASSASARPAEHRFYDKPGKVLFISALTMAGADAASTCHFLTHGGAEDYLPTQHCAQVNLLLFGDVAAQEAVAYLWHRTGHHKLERLTRLVTITANASGLIYSHRRGAL